VGLPSQLGELVDRGGDVVPFALAVDIMNVAASMTYNLHPEIFCRRVNKTFPY
jgi:hypothetical protein